MGCVQHPIGSRQKLMSIESAAGNESAGTTVEGLCEQIDALSQRVTDLEQENERKDERISELENVVDEQDAIIDALRKSKGHTQDRIDDLQDDIERVEERSEGQTPVDTDGDHEPSGSPLCQLTNLPQHMAEEQLSSNKLRARFIGKDVRQYGDMRKGEIVLDSATIRKVLSAKEDREVRWNTVYRVMEYLDEFGKQDSKLKEGRTKIVCFDPNRVGEYGNSVRNPSDLTTVVSGIGGTS